MGSFLQTISQLHHQQPSSFYQKISTVSEPIDKIKEYYGLFKSVCDSFLITKEKYIEIFDSNRNLQEVWDRQKINKLDALELFSGLIAFSSPSTFRQKLKFWFVMFDFNEIKNVSFVDIEYLTLCICNATFKVLGKNAKANESEIVSWLKHFFSQKHRINITKLYAFCIQSAQVKRFFELITKDAASSVSLKDFIEVENNSKQMTLSPTYTIPYIRQTKKQLQDKLQWHRQFSKKISTPYNPNTYLHTAQLSWAYGVRIQNLPKPFILIPSSSPTNSQQLLYSTSTLMIMYNIKTNKQRYYRGHSRLVSSFVYNSSKRLVISASQALSRKAIHVWSCDSLECLKMLDTYKPVKQLALLGKNEQMLIVVCGQAHSRYSLTSPQQKSTIMIFSLEEKLNYALIYSYTYDHLIKQIINIHTNIDESQVAINIWNSFIVVCQNTPTVIFSQFEFQLHTNPQTTDWTANLKTLPYEFYDQPESLHKVNPNKTQKHKNKKITSCIALYINQENPCMRSFITNEESLSLCIITGHQNGQIKCVYYNDNQFSSQDIILQETGTNTPHVARKSVVNSAQNPLSFPETHQQFPITCLHHTSSHIIFSHSSHITVMPFSFLINKEPSHLRTINIMEYPDLKLFSNFIQYFSLSEDLLILVTEKEGDFILLESRKVLFNEQNFIEKENVRKIKTLTKIQSNVNSTMCLLQKVQTQHLIYLTTQDRKILIINSFSKQVQNVWEINSPGDHITAIDAVYTDEDVLYFVCGCKEGKLYIRVDNQENPKFYDCVSEIVDIKISKDASYLLVATNQRYLYFFTQINKNFSSPRKMHFQNQIPACMNFLDSNKMFTVNTSAKNVYTIEIPQLKYKNVQKESQRINISKMKIMYPSSTSIHDKSSQMQLNSSHGNVDAKKGQKVSPYVGHSQKTMVYTKTYLGGQLKYFLMTLHNGQILFFQNRINFSNLSYMNLQAHWGEISNITIVQGQQKFYTLGKYDNTLIEWSTQSTRTLTNVPQSVRLNSEKVSVYELEEFEKMKEISFYYKLLNDSKPDDIYLFRGTQNEKLNEALKKGFKDMIIENSLPFDQQPDQFQQEGSIANTKNQIPNNSKLKLTMRQPNLSLDMSYVFGLQCYKRSSVVFWKQDDQTHSILYHSSRFLFSLDLSNGKKKQKVLEEEKHKITCFIVTQDQKILYALAQPNPKIRIHACDQTMHTTHELGIIHFSTHKHYVLSYGIMKNTYSINLHNYKTGQLLAKRTTELKIHQFIFINSSELVSLNEIRIWKNLYPSQKIGKTTAGILMPNNSDVCLATDNGSISILNTKKGIFTVVTKAHQSDIICMTLNKLQNNSFELLTVSRDDKIKVWNEKFNCKLMINLREELLKNIKFLVENEDQRRGYSSGMQNTSKDTFAGKQNIPTFRSLNIRGIDSRKGKILVYLATGQVYLGKFTMINRQNLDRSIVDDNSEVRFSQDASMVSESNQSIFLEMQKNQNLKNSLDYEKEWEKVIESHSCETNSIFKKFIRFTVHPEFPIIASVGGNDHKLLFRNYETCEIMESFYCEESRITCLKFSRRGKLLAMGFRNGTVKMYQFQVHSRQNVMKGISLQFSQKFTIKQEIFCQPINIEFSQRSLYFAVSFIGSKVQERHQQQGQEQQKQQPLSFIQIYKQKQQYSQYSSSSEETFYSICDTIHIKEEQNNTFSSNKYIKCVYHMAFEYSLRQDGMGMIGMGKDSKQTSQRQSTQKTTKLLQDPSQRTSMCLVMYQQYLNQNGIRLNHSQRDKFMVYVIDEKIFAKKEFDEVDWSGVCFPSMVNVLQLNRFKNQILFMNSQLNQQDKYNQQEDNAEEDIQQSIGQKFDQNPLSITSMCYYKREFAIYGGTHGKLHLVRLNSLLTSNNDPLQQVKQQQMSISKTYVSQTSFISQMQLTTDLKYLFVAGQLDECIIKYNVEELDPQCELDYQAYDIQQNQVLESYVTKDKFYNFINSIMPLREEIKNLLEDVESFDAERRKNNGKEANSVGLEVIKVIGRRAYDRSNNIFMNKEHLIYTLGPNLVIQSIIDPFQQKTLPSDPNPLSYSPQISTIHMKPNSNLLILATEQQASRLFIWDIRASICLSELQVNCSIIYNIKLVGDQYAVFYGINSMYQLVVQVVDWRKKRVVALNNFLHSATWKIRDLCVIELEKQPVQESTIRFYTCGTQHLSEWTIKSNTLIETHFSNIPPNCCFSVLNHYKGQYILTGCEKGNISLWKNRVLLQVLKVQTGPIRSLEVIVKNNTIISGGLDSHLYICKFQEDQIYVESSKSLNPKLQDINNTSNIDESSKGQKQKQKQRQNQQLTTFLTQFDIQSIIYSPLIDTTKNYHSLPHLEECNFFAGTRSGDIYFCQYNLKEKEFMSISHVVYGQDHQTIACTAFSDKEEILYTLTISGKLQVWDLKVLEKVFSYNFMKKAKKIYVYKGYLLICFEKEVIFIELDIRDKIIKIDQTMTLNFDGVISECVLSFNQQYLAIGLHKNESNQIIIYEIVKKEQIYHSPNLKYEIEFLDFSTDEKYLLYKDKFEQIGMIYLVTLKRINTIFVEMKIEWQTEGLRISPKAQRIYCSYNCQNRITTICKLNPNFILVGDQMGTLRVFAYPPDSDKLGQLHTNCYTLHMNKINSIKQHKQLTYVATTAVYDRSLIVWRKLGIH